MKPDEVLLKPFPVLVRNALMFNNEQMSDVHFIVGPPGETQRVPAHKVQEPEQPEMPLLLL